MSLITPVYEKNVRNEKIRRLVLVFFALLILVSIIGAIFMLPSYFYAAFSIDQVLRRLKSSEEVLLKRNFKVIEEKIGSINETIYIFEKNESRRRELAPLLIKIANTTPQSITLKLLKLEMDKNGSARLTINGRAERREDFLSYVEKLKELPEAEAIISPVTNLLKDTDVVFVLEFKVKKEIYSYAP